MPMTFANDEAVMRHALALAERARGFVEPNPMVGAVITDDDRRLIAEGFHERFGGPHAEAAALQAAGPAARGATLFVTLEPCSHYGKTPPCADAVIAAGIRRVVAAVRDPAPHVDGTGFDKLRSAGIRVEVGVCADEAARLIRPFRRRVLSGLPYVIGKWAMSLDGRMATRVGASQWITSEASRRRVHELRGCVDAVMVGIGTALADDPLLTARPPGPRIATRVVVDSRGRLPVDSQLVRTAKQVPLLVATTEGAGSDWEDALHDQGAEVLRLDRCPRTQRVDLELLLRELANRQATNVLVEGGGMLLGGLLDADRLDEVQVFVGPKLFGGRDALSPVLGDGRAGVDDVTFEQIDIETIGTDVWMKALVDRGE